MTEEDAITQLLDCMPVFQGRMNGLQTVTYAEVKEEMRVLVW